MNKNMVRKTAFLVFILIIALSITACAPNNSFTLNSINTKSAGFSGMSSSGLSASNIYLEGKIGAKTYEIQLKTAFENYTVHSFTGEYTEDSTFSFDPEIAHLSLQIKDASGDLTELSMTPGDVFVAAIQDGKAVIVLQEE